MPVPLPSKPLLEEEAGDNPIQQFARWYLDAEAADILEPTAMSLSTTTPDGFPSSRMVLMRGFDERGFAFYTNYRSRKAGELERNPRAALCFFWALLQRQVRIEGTVEKVSAAESDAYYATRPLGHRLGAWASDQSTLITDRKQLEEQMAEVEARFEGQEVTRPEHWGGFRVVPTAIEFWQGRENRLHDRLRYRLSAGGVWVRERLSP